MFGGLLAAIAAAAVILTGGGVNDAQAGSVIVGVDLDSTGNTATSVGTIENTADNVALNTPFRADITVQGVPAPGLFGVGIEILFDPAIVSVTGPPFAPASLAGQVLQYSSGTPSPFGAVVPGAGSLRVDSVDIGIDPPETGDGIVFFFDIECIATGVSTIELIDNATDGGVHAGIQNTLGVFSVSSEIEGVVGCEVPATVPATATPTDPPTATTPAATTPAATTPAATTPAATTPAATTPAATTPAATTAAPTGTAGAGTGTPAATATPGGLPNTGGASSSSGISSLLLISAIGAALVLTAGGSLVAARSARKE